MPIVGQNSTDLGRRVKHIVRLLLAEKGMHGLTIGQIELAVRAE